MPHGRAVKKRRLRVILPLAGLVVTAYFGWHAYHGAHGLLARQSLMREDLRLATEIKGLRAHREAIERHIALLKPQSLDPDYLEERSVSLLNFISPDVRELKPQTDAGASRAP